MTVWIIHIAMAISTLGTLESFGGRVFATQAACEAAIRPALNTPQQKLYCEEVKVE